MALQTKDIKDIEFSEDEKRQVEKMLEDENNGKRGISVADVLANRGERVLLPSRQYG